MVTFGTGLTRAFHFAAMLVVAAPVTTFAQTGYPNRTIRIVVPIPPGPVADVLPRLLAEKLSARWGQPVIIENRPGARAKSRCRGGRESDA